MSDPITPTGDTPAPRPLTAELVRQMSHDYQVPVAEDTVQRMVNPPNGAAAPVEAVHHYFKEQAKGLYPSWATHIGAGLAPAHLMEPYRQVAKQMLGPDAEFDWANDAKARAAMEGGREADGRPRPMTLTEWRTHIATTPEFGFQHTPQAHEVARSFGRALHESFGERLRG